MFQMHMINNDLRKELKANKERLAAIEDKKGTSEYILPLTYIKRLEDCIKKNQQCAVVKINHSLVDEHALKMLGQSYDKHFTGLNAYDVGLPFPITGIFTPDKKLFYLCYQQRNNRFRAYRMHRLDEVGIHSWTMHPVVFNISVLEHKCKTTMCVLHYDKTERDKIGKNAMHDLSFLNCALMLINCKNINLVGQPSRKNKKRNSPIKKVDFYELELDLNKTSTQYESCHSNSGITKRIHVCRGHFRTYKNKPLLGKIYGRFWIPAHVRGKNDNGAIVKDYNVTMK